MLPLSCHATYLLRQPGADCR